MSDKAIANALARREEISSKINQLQDEISELRKEAGRVDQFIADWKSFAGEDSGAEVAPEKNLVRNVIRNFAAAIIDGAGRPVPRKELYDEMRRRKAKINAQNPLMALSTTMWHLQEVFVRIPKYGYWFRDRPYPPAGYTPGDIPDTRKSGGSESDHVEDNDNDDGELPLRRV